MVRTPSTHTLRGRASTGLVDEPFRCLASPSMQHSTQAVTSDDIDANTLCTDERDYPPRDRSRSPDAERDRDGDIRVRDEPSNGRADR